MYMLDLGKSTIGANVERPLASGSDITEDGMIVKRIGVNGVTGAALAVGAGTEDILGVVQVEKPSNLKRPVIGEAGAVPASPGPYTFTLKYSNLVANSYRFTEVGGGAITPDSVDDLTGIVTFNVGDAGKVFVADYTYKPTVEEAAAIFGDSFVFRTYEDIFEMVPVLCGNCEIFTLLYDTSQAYAVGDALYVSNVSGQEGRFTTASTATQFGTVTKIPDSDGPYLGVSYDTKY